MNEFDDLQERFERLMEAPFNLKKEDAIKVAVQMQQNKVLAEAFQIEPFALQSSKVPYLDAIATALGFDPSRLKQSNLIEQLEVLNDHLENRD